MNKAGDIVEGRVAGPDAADPGLRPAREVRRRVSFLPYRCPILAGARSRAQIHAYINAANLASRQECGAQRISDFLVVLNFDSIIFLTLSPHRLRGALNGSNCELECKVHPERPVSVP